MASITTADFRNGMTLKQGDHLFTLIEFQHVKPGKGGAFVRTKLKNLNSGAVTDKRFRAGERVEEVRLERRSMQYLYRSDDLLHFMDMETYDQYTLNGATVGDGIEFLKEGETVSALMQEDGQPFGIDVPFFVELSVTETDPGIRGDTATGGSKPATLETGVVVQVPLFINTGDRLKIDTRTGTYMERAS